MAESVTISFFHPVNGYLNSMIVLGGPTGDMAWYFKTQKSNLKDTTTNKALPYQVVWKSSHYSAAASGSNGNILRLVATDNFLMPAQDKNNNYIVSNGDRNNAIVASRFIVVAHELGHVIVDLRDSNSESKHMGGSIALAENVGRTYLQFHMVAHRPLPGSPKPLDSYVTVNLRESYSGNVAAPINFRNLHELVEAKRARGQNTAASIGQAELNRAKNFANLVKPMIFKDQEVMKQRNEYLEGILARTRERVDWAILPARGKKKQTRIEQIMIADFVIKQMYNLYPDYLAQTPDLLKKLDVLKQWAQNEPTAIILYNEGTKRR